MAFSHFYGSAWVRSNNLCKVILLPSARHLEERLESVSYADSQPISQSARQAGKQIGRQKHTVWFFLVAAYSYKQWGTTFQHQISMVEWWHTIPPFVHRGRR